MRLSVGLVFTSVVLSLAACGGGSDAPSPSTPVAAAPAPSFAEFEGRWKRDAASDVCLPAFPYNTAHHFRLQDILVAPSNNNLDATVAVVAYADAGCNTPLGVVRETFALQAQGGVLSGRSNVVKGSPVFKGFTISADGGLGLTVTRMPDGSLSMLNGRRFSSDVDNNRLYVTTSTMNVAQDSEGFPSTIVLSESFVR